MGEVTVNDDKAPDASNTDKSHKESSDAVVTVVLTADNHLGYVGFGQHPRKREERQQRLRDAFQQATDFAIVQGVDLFIQAGDLFDTTSPDELDRSFVAGRLAQFLPVDDALVVLAQDQVDAAAKPIQQRRAHPAQDAEQMLEGEPERA